MTRSRALTLAFTCIIIVAICWVTISAVTTPFRAMAAGLVLAAMAGALIWVAGTDRRATARGIIAIGAAALTAPLAGMQAFFNDFLYSIADETEFARRLDTFETDQAMGWSMVGVGVVCGLILMIVGGLMHRRTSRDL